jgi:hypothetical protein
MQVRNLMLSAILLLVSIGCVAQKNRSQIPAGDFAKAETFPQSELNEMILQLVDELVSGNWLRQFTETNSHQPFILILPDSENQDPTLTGLISGRLLESGKLSLVLPKEGSPTFTIPRERESALTLKANSGADFLLVCSYRKNNEDIFSSELIDLDNAEVIYSKSVIVNKIKT